MAVCRLMIPKPTHNANTPIPLECTATFTCVTLDGESQLPPDMDLDQGAKTAIKNRHRTILKTKADDLQSRLSEPQRRAMREKGCSVRFP